MSSALTALIWWLIPAAGLIGAFGYVLWVTKFRGKFEQKTQRSVGQFQRFQGSLRERQRLDLIARGSPGAANISEGRSLDGTFPQAPPTPRAS